MWQKKHDAVRTRMHIGWPLLQPIFIQRGIVSAAISERRTPHRLSLLFAFSTDFL